MAAISEITEKLKNLLRADVPSRPFLCEGTPEGCEVILVGINPATITPFWEFWGENGCDKKAWLQDYIDREGRFKPTRKRIEIIASVLAPEIKTLELNIFPYSSPREAALPLELRDSRPFEYVMLLASPRLLFVYGATPANELSKLLGCELLFQQFTQVNYSGRQFEAYVDRHLSFQWSDAAVRQLAENFKCRLLEPRVHDSR